MVKCTEYKTNIPEGEGRFNFPNGVKCVDYGSPISDVLKVAEELLEIYSKLSGYRVRASF